MKKTLLSFGFLLLLAPATRAATLNSGTYNKLHFNEAKQIQPIEITTQANAEITAANGISIFLDQERHILWDAVETVTLEGPAVTEGYVEATVTPEYRNGYKIVHIPVKKDWPGGATATLTGLRLRAYSYLVGQNYYFGYDLTGDGVADVQDINSYFVTNDDIRADQTPPYLPANVSYQVAPQKNSVTLKWQNPPDYDLVGITVIKKLKRGGNDQPEVTIASDSFAEQTTDADVQADDVITYELFSRDTRNQSDRVVVTVNVNEPEPTPEPVQPATKPAPAPTAEVTELSARYGSFKLRYQIKCTPSGVAVPFGNSECLWAKIDLAYAQAKLDRADLAVVLSSNEKRIIGLRLPFAQRRYQQECVATPTPAKNCTALGQALERANYFLSQD